MRTNKGSITRVRGWFFGGVFASLCAMGSLSAGDLEELDGALELLNKVKQEKLGDIAKGKHLESLRPDDIEERAKEAIERLSKDGDLKDSGMEAARAAIEAAKAELSGEGKSRLETQLEGNPDGKVRDRSEPELEEGPRFMGTYLSELDPGPNTVLGEFPEVGGYESPEGTVFIATGKNGASLYDLDRNLILFTGTVALDHPNFYLTCERLEVHLVPPSESGSDEKSGNKMAVTMERAIATSSGQVVIERKLAEGQDEDDLEVGRCRKATYFGGSGDVLLEVWPEIQKGRHVQRASQEGTRISLPQGGQPKVTGQSKIVLSKAPPEKIQRVRPE